ncbi:immunoglobulin i-set domain-containing protein [Ditylenchus destructor]|nr:immunoglobulin i-set domain-containing protein [Ditylenchus destructor]
MIQPRRLRSLEHTNYLLRSTIWSIVLVDVLASSGLGPKITEHPLDILVVKGDPATLRCGTSGENVEIQWFKDNVLVKVNVNGHRLLLPNGSLFLLKVNNGGADSDAGTYYCIAKNEHGQVQSQEANVKIALLRDDFRVNPHAIQVLLNQKADLECSPPKGFPDPVVSWRKDDRDVNLMEDSRYKLHPSGNLIIENVQRSDGGFYQCVAGNMVGERISKPARLSVYEKPRFLAEPKDMSAEVNSSVLFDCRVAGEPMPSISWKKRNDNMPIGRAYVTKDSRGLRIDRVQPEDSGEYVCFAKNPVGSIETSAKLRVNSPPVFTKLPENVRLNDIRSIDQGNYICAAVNAAGSTLAKASLAVLNSANPSYPPPVIQYGHQNQTLMVNDMAVMPCQATSRVPAHITWLKDGQLLNITSGDQTDDGSRYRQLVTGTLQISDLKKSDTGVYTCRAKNEDGEATWTASLIVEEHTNPNTMFQRMPDAAAFPSAPGKPAVLNTSEDSIELEWTVPERHGASPIIGYILQYWSPMLGDSWWNVLDVIPSAPKFRVKHLKPSHSYAFVVRAENSKGIGPPSSISDIVTTKATTTNFEEDRMSQLMDLESARQKLASEQLIKLQEVKPINATAMLLTWKRQRKEPLVQGFYIKWRGPPLTPDHSWVNVSQPEADSVIINGLRPFNNYEFFVIPYHQSVQGMPSNSLDGTTHEAPPSMPPSDVRIRMLNLTSLRVSWRPPPADSINGILKGFIINIRSNQSEERDITTNERATSITLYRLLAGASYSIRIAAKTNAGYGVYHNAEIVVMNEETLRHHLRMASESRHMDTWYKQPWSVMGIGLVLWCILLLMFVLLWYRCCHRRKSLNKEREFIKIRDGSVANTAARDAFWASHDQFNGTMGPNGTVETYSSGAMPGNRSNCDGHSIHGEGCCYSDYGGSACGVGATMPQSMLYNMMQHPPNGHPVNCSTLQRGESQHSPPHHYHYAQLPEDNGRYGGRVDNNNDGLTSFYNQSQYYDDPSPYATTTLVMNGSNTAGRRDNRHRQARPVGGTLNRSNPPLPVNPIPRQPPSNFLSRTAVAAEACCNAARNDSRHSLILENDHLKGSTAGDSHKYYCGSAHRHMPNVDRHRQSPCTAHHGISQNSAVMKQRRNSGVHDGQTDGPHHSSNTVLAAQQRDSPQTDVSYIQSSDGTNGSSKARRSTEDRISPPANILDLVPPPPRGIPPPEDFNESRHSMNDYDSVLEGPTKPKANGRTSRNDQKQHKRVNGRRTHQPRNRISLLEDEEQRCEIDPLMNYDLEAEADAELSEDENGSQNSPSVANADEAFDLIRTIRSETADSNDIQNGVTYCSRPSRQPLMGVNVSTLSQNSNDGNSSMNGARRSASKLKQPTQRSAKTDFV